MENQKIKVGDLVITPVKNRWGIKCCGIIEKVCDKTADVQVWNVKGPGADMLITEISLSELVLAGE